VAPAAGSNPESTFAGYLVGTGRSKKSRVAMTSRLCTQVGRGSGCKVGNKWVSQGKIVVDFQLLVGKGSGSEADIQYHYRERVPFTSRGIGGKVKMRHHAAW